MSRFRDYLEKTTPLFVEQFSKFWRSEYLYLNVLNNKGSNLGRLGIEVRHLLNKSHILQSLILELQLRLPEISDQYGSTTLLL